MDCVNEREVIRSPHGAGYMFRAVFLGIVSLAAVASVRPAYACPGDCNGDGRVSINELILGVNIALGNAPLAQCPAFDGNASGSVEINELVRGVNAALGGCPDTGSPTATPSYTATSTPIPPTATDTPGAPTPTQPPPPTPPAATATAPPLPTDTATAESTPTHTQGPPPDPADVAPAFESGAATDVGSATSFLYDPPPGKPAIQIGVAPDAIERRRAAVIRGRVLESGGAPLPEVTISVLGHPEFGQTASRADGRFDLAVNGGSQVQLVYRREGFLPGQRRVRVPWQDYATVDDLIMMPVDAEMTAIDFGPAAPPQMAMGSVSVDGDGARRGAVVIPGGTVAMLEMPDGAMIAADSLSLRITEYTVGADGPRQMPAPLPPNSGYTYAFALTADQALASGGRVHLTAKLPYYVDNFLAYPVGTIAPLGGLDPETGRWVPTDSGRVIRIAAIDGGLAEIDSDGDGLADDLLGLEAEERALLAERYPAGAELWRVVLGFDEHGGGAVSAQRSGVGTGFVDAFGAWDINWGFGPPDDAEAPMVPDPEVDVWLDEPCEKRGSIVECQNQILREQVRLVGSRARLHYSSAAVPGRNAPVVVTASGPDPLPASLHRIEVTMSVAGQVLGETLPPLPNQQVVLQWDRRDAYGRAVEGAQKAEIAVAYVYPAVVMTTERFGYNGNGIAIEGAPSRQEVRLVQRFSRLLQSRDARNQGIGGWTLSNHHQYDPLGRTLHLGNGRRRSEVNTLGPVMEQTVTTFGNPTNMEFAPDGSLYYVSADILFRLNLDGTVDTLSIGCAPGELTYVGQLPDVSTCGVRGLAIAPDGVIYLGDAAGERHVIRRVDPSGNVTEIAGVRGVRGFTPDGEMAQGNLLTFTNQTFLDIAPDGTLYFAETGSHRIRRIDADGRLSTVAGPGEPCLAPAPRHCLDYSGVPATSVSLSGWFGVSFEGMQVGEDGSVIIAHGWDANEHVISRVTPDGILRRFIASGSRDSLADGIDPGRDYSSYPVNLALAPNGDLYYGTQAFIGIHTYHLLRQYRAADGLVYTYAGVPGAILQPESGDGGPARAAIIRLPTAVAVDPAGRVCFRGENKIRCVGSSLPGFDATNHLVASEDGANLYRFDLGGRHLETLHALTNEVLEHFEYGADGLLVRIVEHTGGVDNVTTIERDGNGNPVAIVAPYGQRTQLAVDADGWLSSVANPAGETVDLHHTPEGLLTGLTTARGHGYTYEYDAAGRLVREDDPAGGSQSLDHARPGDDGEAPGVRVTHATAIGRETTYEVTEPVASERRERRVDPDGSETETVHRSDGSGATVLPDGSEIRRSYGPDPRFGMQSRTLVSAVVRLPSTLESEYRESRVVELADPSDVSSLLTLTEAGNANGRVASSTFDAGSKTFTTESAAGRPATLVIDALGRPLEGRVGDLAPRSATYDERGRVATLTVGLGEEARTTGFTYDERGNLATVVDALGGVESFEYDGADRLAARILPDGRRVDLAWDANGNLTSITPPGRPAHTFAYTPVDLESEYTPPGIGLMESRTRRTYDFDRMPLITEYADGRSVQTTYDDAGRLAALSFSRGNIELAYDAGSGRITEIAAPGGALQTFAYDGILLTEEEVAGPVNGVVRWSYDGDLRVAQESVGDDDSVSFVYDADNRLLAAGELVFERDPSSGLVLAAAIGGLEETWDYNSFGEPTRYEVTFDGALVYRLDLTYDALARIVRKVETIAGGTNGYDYDYDLAGRLVEVTMDGGPVTTYTYDDNDNLLSRAVAGSLESMVYDAQDRLLEISRTSGPTDTFSYDAHGRLATRETDGASTVYTYDELGGLTSVVLSGGGTLEYILDGFGRRIGRRVDGEKVAGYLYDDALRVVAELDASDQIVSRYVYAFSPNVPEYFTRGDHTYRLITDHLGSPRLVIDVVDGAVVQRMRHDEFGRVLQDDAPGSLPFGFAGGLADASTGLIRFGARDYDPQTGRWTAKDPIGFTAGSANLYAYADGDPINRFDPTGLDTSDPFDRLDRALWANGLNNRNFRAMIIRGVRENPRLAEYLRRDKLDASQLAKGKLGEAILKCEEVIRSIQLGKIARDVIESGGRNEFHPAYEQTDYLTYVVATYIMTKGHPSWRYSPPVQITPGSLGRPNISGGGQPVELDFGLLHWLSRWW